MRKAPRFDLVAFGVALAASILLAASGVASWPVLVAAAAPWVVVAARRFGTVLGAALVLLATLLVFELALMATASLSLPMVPTVTTLATALGALGLVGVWRGGVIERPSRWTLLSAIAPLTGGVAWLGVLGLAQVLPGAAPLAWVMSGDAANNVLFGREVVYRGGIGVGPDENPVPLPTGILGYVIDAGRAGTAPADLLRHDIAGFSLSWGLLIAFSCVLVGVAMAALVRRAGGAPSAVAVTGAVGSLMPLSWFISGYPLDFGFFNTHVAIIVLCAAYLAYLSSERHAAAALAALAIAAVLVLSIWSPLVLLPGCLGLAVVIRRWRALIATRGVPLVVLVASLAVAIGYSSAVVLPSLLAQADFLSAVGGVIAFFKPLIVIFGVGALVFAVTAFRSIRDDAVIGTLAIATGSALGLAALLVIARAWSYYPLKFAWLACVMLLIIGVGNAAATVVRVARQPRYVGSGQALVATATITVLLVLSAFGPDYSAVNPLRRVLTGQSPSAGQAFADRLFALADPTQARVLWRSGDPDEASINFWLLQLWSDSTTENFALRVAAYEALAPTGDDDLCSTIRLMDADVTVITSDVTLADTMNELCPEDFARATVELRPSPDDAQLDG